MKKTIISLTFIFLLSLTLVYALDECKGTMNENEPPCYLLLPVNTTETACNTLIVHIYNDSNSLYNQTMNQFNYFTCNATFNKTEWATYSFLYSTSDSGTIIIEENEDNTYYLYISVFIVLFVLLIIGYWLEEENFHIIAGMLCAIIAINIWINGFPNLTNDFLKNGIAIVLAGIGFYFIVGPVANKLQKYGG